jgi:hypothetical protein
MGAQDIGVAESGVKLGISPTYLHSLLNFSTWDIN